MFEKYELLIVQSVPADCKSYIGRCKAWIILVSVNYCLWNTVTWMSDEICDLVIRKMRVLICLFQRMWDSTLPKSGAQASESVSKHILRCSHVFYGRLRGFCTWHLALAALHGHHDLRCSHSSTYSGMCYVLRIIVLLIFHLLLN